MKEFSTKKQIRFIPGDAETDPHIAYADGKTYGTASGRFEFYREMPMPRAATTKTTYYLKRSIASAWLAGYPPLEAWPENELYKKYPLVLMKRASPDTAFTPNGSARRCCASLIPSRT